MREHCGWDPPGGFDEMRHNAGDSHPSRCARHPPRER